MAGLAGNSTAALHNSVTTIRESEYWYSMDWRKHTWKYTKTQESNFCVRVNAYLECGFQCLDLSVIESLLKVPSQAGAPPLAT